MLEVGVVVEEADQLFVCDAAATGREHASRQGVNLGIRERQAQLLRDDGAELLFTDLAVSRVVRDELELRVEEVSALLVLLSEGTRAVGSRGRLNSSELSVDAIANGQAFDVTAASCAIDGEPTRRS